MAPPASSLSPAKTALLAAYFAAAADLVSLRSLIALHPETLKGETLFGVLLCLPETTPPELYTPLLRSIIDNAAITPPPDAKPLNTAPVAPLSEKTALKRLERLPKLPEQHKGSSSPMMAAFLLQRSRNIDSETGALSLIKDLLAPFLELKDVERYYKGSVEVMAKLVYEYTATTTTTEEAVGGGGLAAFETLDPEAGVRVLLRNCGKGTATVVEDLKVLVVPYLNFRGGGGWTVVWKWMADKARVDWGTFIKIVKEWDGPEDADLRRDYARLAVAGCYICRQTGEEVLEGMHTVHGRVSGILAGGGWVAAGKIERVGALMDWNNPLTAPSQEALAELDLFVTSAGILSLPLADVARYKFEGSHERQKTLLVAFVRMNTKRDDNEWKHIRDGARWLNIKAGVLGKLVPEEVEKVVLAGLLAATKFELVNEIYIDSKSRGSTGLSKKDIETCVLDAFREFYDNASNGNKTRGSMKNAASTLQLLYPRKLKSNRLAQASRLLSATHALSQFSLTLQPSVPLLPVQIRLQPDPPVILGRLLDQNPKSYTQPDTLIQIAKDLTYGITADENTKVIEARVLGMCVEAALSEDDFETAYSFVLSRLVPPKLSEEQHEDVRDVIWRAAFQAGRYRSPYAALAGVPPKGPKGLRELEMRMELLGQAMRICPPIAIADVLTAWKRCEDEREVIINEEAAAEEAHAAAGGMALGVRGLNGTDVAIAAGTRGEEEAPMGLFAVAAGAAKAIRGSAFPLSAGGGRGNGTTTAAAVTGNVDGTGEAAERVRKRDMVSGMVTSGLASGLGWVLGAQPKRP